MGAEPDDALPPMEAMADLLPIDRYGDPDRIVPACDEPSPTGVMLCFLPRTTYRHSMGQHLGLDRHDNYRGWKDKRPV